MKAHFILFILMAGNISFSQPHVDYTRVDQYVSSINAASPDSLAKELTQPFNTESEKVRSIFKWITENISYHTPKVRGRTVPFLRYLEDDDTFATLKPLNERVALNVLSRKTAVCDGYARLFKTLCDYAGIESEIVRGFARTYSVKKTAFTSNHIWNAVKIGGAWHLLDVTWASGFISYGANEFVKAYDDFYFLTPASAFARDHYPEDIKWTLMENPPPIKEFQFSPFKYAAITHFKVSSYFPATGIVVASPGDTISFCVEANEAEKVLRISNSSFVNPIPFNYDDPWNYPRPVGLVTSRNVRGIYAVASGQDEWLYVILNEEVILRYRLVIEKTGREVVKE